jgi:hypothetical protein
MIEKLLSFLMIGFILTSLLLPLTATISINSRNNKIYQEGVFEYGEKDNDYKITDLKFIDGLKNGTMSIGRSIWGATTVSIGMFIDFVKKNPSNRVEVSHGVSYSSTDIVFSIIKLLTFPLWLFFWSLLLIYYFFYFTYHILIVNAKYLYHIGYLSPIMLFLIIGYFLGDENEKLMKEDS